MVFVFIVKLTLCEEPLLRYQTFTLFSPLQLKANVVSMLLKPLFFQHFLNLLLQLDRVLRVLKDAVLWK